MTPSTLFLTLTTTVLLTATLATAQVPVQGYTRRDGTHVDPYTRTLPDATPRNNYSYPGNYNPNTGHITGGDPWRQRLEVPAPPISRLPAGGVPPSPTWTPRTYTVR